DQIASADPEFVDDPDPRWPCVLLLDTSGSMNDPRQVKTALSPVQRILNESPALKTLRQIDELNASLVAFRDELLVDEMAVKRVELSLVTFGPVRKLTEFQNPDIFRPPSLGAEGDTPMGIAIERAIEMVRERKL